MILFAFGTFWFWFLIGAFVILEIIWTERESFTGSIFTVAAFVAALHLFSDIAIISWLVSNPLNALLYIVGFFVVGCFWSGLKFFFYLKKETLSYKTARMSWLKESGLANVNLNSKVPPQSRKRWLESTGYGGQRKTLHHLDANHNKGRMLMWAMHWPMSMIGTAIRDPFVHAYNFMAERLQMLSDKIVGDAIGNDLDAPKKDETLSDA